MYVILSEEEQPVTVSIVVTVTFADDSQRSGSFPALGTGVTQIDLNNLEIVGFLPENIGECEEPER